MLYDEFQIYIFNKIYVVYFLNKKNLI